VLHHLKHKAQKPGITSTLGKIERNSGQCGKENRTKNIKNQIKNGRVRNQPFHLANFIKFYRNFINPEVTLSGPVIFIIPHLLQGM
jgi:hypothetical protein